MITGIYVTSMALFASIGPEVSYPLAVAGMDGKSASVIWPELPCWRSSPGFLRESLAAHGKAAAAIQKVQCIPTGGHLEITAGLYITLFFGLQSLNFIL